MTTCTFLLSKLHATKMYKEKFYLNFYNSSIESSSKGIGIFSKNLACLWGLGPQTREQVKQKPQNWATTCRRKSSSNPIKKQNYFDTWKFLIFAESLVRCSSENLNLIENVVAHMCRLQSPQKLTPVLGAQMSPHDASEWDCVHVRVHERVRVRWR